MSQKIDINNYMYYYIKMEKLKHYLDLNINQKINYKLTTIDLYPYEKFSYNYFYRYYINF